MLDALGLKVFAQVGLYMKQNAYFPEGGNGRGLAKKGWHSHQHFNIWFFWYEEVVIKIWSWYLQWFQNAKTLNLESSIYFHKTAETQGIPTLRTCHFEASEDIMTKFKSQAFHVIRSRYWKAGGSGNPPSLILALWNIGILPHIQATLGKHFEPKSSV